MEGGAPWETAEEDRHPQGGGEEGAGDVCNSYLV